MVECMLHMSQPALPPQGLSPHAAESSEAAEDSNNVYILEALDEQSTHYEQLQGSLSGNEDPGNFLLDLDVFMDTSVLDFVNDIVPPKTIRHDQEPENQQVSTHGIGPNRQTLHKNPLLPMK